MKRDALPIVLLCGVALVMVVAALATVGGPGKGALEKRDRTRLSDMRELRRHVLCVKDKTGALPETLASTGECAVPRATDPFTGAPYGYARQSSGAHLCAEFEDVAFVKQSQPRHQNSLEIDAETGCVKIR